MFIYYIVLDYFSITNGVVQLGCVFFSHKAVPESPTY